MAFERNRIHYVSQIYSQSSAEESEGPTSSGENKVKNEMNDNATTHFNRLNPSYLDRNSRFQSKNNLGREMRRCQSQRKPKCFSKNAQMARENRLKKKIHLAKLEKEAETLKKDKSRLSNIIESQSLLISQLKNEVRYLKGVLANSSDISKIMRNIQQGTGMSVSTSLNKSLNINESCSRSKVPISKKTMCPWEEEVDNFCQMPTLEMYRNEGRLCDDLDLDFPSNNEHDLTPFLFDQTDSLFGLETVVPNLVLDSLEEHNYTSKSFENEDVGICLHVSKHRVSLELCSSCEENAKENCS